MRWRCTQGRDGVVAVAAAGGIRERRCAGAGMEAGERKKLRVGDEINGDEILHGSQTPEGG